MPVLVTAALAVLLLSLRYAWWRPAVDYRRPRILMYHMVSEHRRGAGFNKLRVPPARFAAQLRWLRDDGWYFAFVSELEHPQLLPPRTVVLTFDDGYEDNLRHAQPLIERYRARATLYLVEDRHDNDWSRRKKAHHDSGELVREPKLSDAQVESLLASGCWELGAHTRSHANLARLHAAGRRREIASSRAALARRFGVPMRSFAYPFGIYGRADVEAVREAGFATAVTTCEGIPRDLRAEALQLPRLKVSGREGLWAFRLRLRTGRRGL